MRKHCGLTRYRSNGHCKVRSLIHRVKCDYSVQRIVTSTNNLTAPKHVTIWFICVQLKSVVEQLVPLIIVSWMDGTMNQAMHGGPPHETPDSHLCLTSLLIHDVADTLMLLKILLGKNKENNKFILNVSNTSTILYKSGVPTMGASRLPGTSFWCCMGVVSLSSLDLFCI